MNKVTITKVLNKVENSDNTYSTGFNRLAALPAKCRKALNLASLIAGIIPSEVHETQKAFLQDLSSVEFVNWMSIN